MKLWCCVMFLLSILSRRDNVIYENMNFPTQFHVYPGLTQLYKQLTKHVDDSGVSRELKADIEEATETLLSNKQYYFQQLALYTEVKELLLDNNYGLPDQRFEEHNGDNRIYKLISDLMSGEEAKSCLNITMKGKTTNIDEEHLFGLSAEDLDIEPRTKKIFHQNIQQVCIPQIEKKLKTKSLELFKFWNPSNQDSEGLALAKANQLAVTLTNERKKLEEVKQALREEEEKYDNKFHEHYQELIHSLKDLEENVNLLKLKPNSGSTKVTVDWLDAKCDYIRLKIRVMKNHLLAETYTNETLEALQKIRNYLDSEISKTRTEHHKIKQSLQIYESVGDTFKDMLHQYTQITTQIDNKKWALSELRRSKDV